MKLKHLLFLLFPFFCISQTKTIGLVKYHYKIPMEVPLYKTADLYFNNNTSIFKIGKADNKSDIGVTMSSKGISIISESEDEEGSQFYRDYQKKTLIFRAPKELFDSYIVHDTWIPIQWKIKKRFKKIGNYRCQKAVGEFRGRTYTAWFTEAIPLPYGPWKLFGLPGLILEAEDSEKLFKATFKSIQYPCSNCTFEFKKPTATQVKTLKEYVAFRDNFNYHLYKKMVSKMPRRMAKNLRPMPNNKSRKYRDEKIFEWETKE